MQAGRAPWRRRPLHSPFWLLCRVPAPWGRPSPGTSSCLCVPEAQGWPSLCPFRRLDTMSLCSLYFRPHRPPQGLPDLPSPGLRAQLACLLLGRPPWARDRAADWRRRACPAFPGESGRTGTRNRLRAGQPLLQPCPGSFPWALLTPHPPRPRALPPDLAGGSVPPEPAGHAHVFLRPSDTAHAVYSARPPAGFTLGAGPARKDSLASQLGTSTPGLPPPSWRSEIRRVRVNQGAPEAVPAPPVPSAGTAKPHPGRLGPLHQHPACCGQPRTTGIFPRVPRPPSPGLGAVWEAP